MTVRLVLLAAACLLVPATTAFADKKDAFRIDKRDFRKQYKVIALAPPILRHRMALTFTARADGLTIDGVIGELLRAV